MVLLVSSLFFYYWGERDYVAIMFVSTAIDYSHGLIVERCKERGNDKGARMAVTSSIIFNLGLLFFFKYWDFVALSLQGMGLDFMPVLNIHLPIGISFYTFQTMSYTIDVYRGDARAQRSILNFGTFVTLFPQLIAGPIIKYKDLGDQIDSRDCTMDKFGAGVEKFMVGMGKKVLIANNVGMLWEAYKAMNPGELTVLGACLGVLAFTFQIYFDFSGYSDMATGLGRMLGFEFLPNFNYPYISKSATEFWRRWHISLGAWFRDYVYIPLGGSRCSIGKHIRNLLIVWALTGIWHGANWNFIAWGLFHGGILLIEKFLLKEITDYIPKPIRIFTTVILAMIGWVFFFSPDLGSACVWLGRMFGIGATGFMDATAKYYLSGSWLILLIGTFSAYPIGARLGGNVYRIGKGAIAVSTLWFAVLLVLCIAGMLSSTYSSFLYFQF